MIYSISLLLLSLCPCLLAQSVKFHFSEPHDDRWMYPHNGTPGTRPQASTFSALPLSAGSDDRWAFFLLGFQTSQQVPVNLPPEFYRIRSVRITATVGSDNYFRYDGSYDSWQTYATTTRSAQVADADIGRPVELHGVGFRNGFNASNFTEFSAHGSSSPGMRNAFPMSYSPNGTAIDISSNVTQAFESNAWAIGQSDISPGGWVPEGTELRFDLNLTIPGVRTYLQQSLSAGRLWLAIDSMHPAFEMGGEFVPLYTKEDFGHELFGGLAPTLEIEVEIAHPLHFQIVNQQVHLQWPTYAGNQYVLQTSTNLALGSWQNLSQIRVTQHSSSQFTTPFTIGSRFFRLSIQPITP
jgi:hypothetical protein